MYWLQEHLQEDELDSSTETQFFLNLQMPWIRWMSLMVMSSFTNLTSMIFNWHGFVKNYSKVLAD